MLDELNVVTRKAVQAAARLITQFGQECAKFGGSVKTGCGRLCVFVKDAARAKGQAAVHIISEKRSAACSFMQHKKSCAKVAMSAKKEQLASKNPVPKARNFCDEIHDMWARNHYFSLWFIPGNGQRIAKKNIKKKYVKYAFAAMAVLGVAVAGTFGVLAHMAYESYVQRAELAEYKATKAVHEAKLQELTDMAEKNQKELAYLNKLEEQVRSQLEKNGATLPSKSQLNGGQGGPMNGNEISQMDILIAQEKNIHQQLEAKKADLEKLLTTIKEENYRREYTPSLWPTDSYDVTSSYGGRVNPFDGYSSDWHPGVDIANNYDAPVYASASGVVLQSGWYGGYGRYIKLEHDYGFTTAYGHMSSLAVSAGQYVKKGEIIGYVGSSGYSTGPHLHFEVMQYGEQVNPAKYM